MQSKPCRWPLGLTLILAFVAACSADTVPEEVASDSMATEFPWKPEDLHPPQHGFATVCKVIDGVKNCMCAWDGPEGSMMCDGNLRENCPQGSTPSCTPADKGHCSCDSGLVASPASCAGRCGVYDAFSTCQCDRECPYFGDCCWDRAFLCGPCSCSPSCDLQGNCCVFCPIDIGQP
jgi:Somatomedin B domain